MFREVINNAKVSKSNTMIDDDRLFLIDRARDKMFTSNEMCHRTRQRLKNSNFSRRNERNN